VTFPTVPRDTSTEFYLNGDWVDVTSDVRAADGIQITRGQPNEAGQSQPATCSLTLDNRSGNYSPRNPMGAYYGMLGRNTPIRVSVNTAKDMFSRTSASGWGAADTGQSWSIIGAGGVVAATDFTVGSGAGKHSIPTDGTRRITYLDGFLARDVEVYATISLPFTDVTGGNLDANVMLRLDPATEECYLARIVFPPNEVVTIGFIYRDPIGTLLNITDFNPIPGITHAAGQQLAIRAQCVNQTLRMKVWVATNPEPFDWTLVSSDVVLTTARTVGLRSSRATGNTNAFPIVFSYDDFMVRSVRFAGEVSAWPQRWDTSGLDVTAPIEAASILRRLAQGTAPQLSTLYRAITGLVTPAVAYWPCEEGSDSDSIASAVGGPSMVVVGDTNFAAYGEFASSYPIPVPQTTSTWSGTVPTYTATTELQLSFIAHVPSSGAADLSHFIELTTTSGRTWSVKYHTGVPALGSMSVQLWEYSTLLFDSGPFAFAVNGKDVRITLALEQNGSDIDWELRSLEADSSGGGFISGTQVNRTVGRALRVRAFPHGEMTGVPMGHISVRNEITNFWDLSAELRAFAGETVVERLIRLSEQNLIFTDFFVTAFGAAVGPQRPLPLLTLMQECVDADRSMLFDVRSAPELLYRQLSTMYAQTAAVTLDYGGGQIAPPFQPIDDDQLTRNDISVTRLDGGTARAVLETGRMSILTPELGGVGTYNTEVNVNVASDDQLPDIAGWELNKGTVDETRYPVVRVGLHFPEVSGDAALSAALLDLDVGDRFEITNPMAGQTPDTIDQICLGYTETIGVFTHDIAINAAPASPYRVSALDDPESRLDTSGSDLTNAVTTSATSFQVDSPSGTLWTTRAGDMPIPVMLGGEEISVGAVSGTSSPQTFSSVTRSVNGTVKAHSAGTALSVARPRVLGL